MKLLSLKEFAAVFELIVGGLGVWNYYVIDIYDEKLHDVNIFMHRCVNLSLGFISFFYAFGTWFWFSHIRMTRMLNRLHTVVVYLVLNIALLFTHFSYKANYGPQILGHFDHGIFYDEDYTMSKNFYILLVILVLSLLIIGINTRYLVLRLLRMQKKNKLTK